VDILADALGFVLGTTEKLSILLWKGPRWYLIDCGVYITPGAVENWNRSCSMLIEGVI
jgi:hypothetical protein